MVLLEINIVGIISSVGGLLLLVASLFVFVRGHIKAQKQARRNNDSEKED